MPKTNCPYCGTELAKVNSDQLYCSKCIGYKIDGIWKRVWCDEYHRHNSECLVDYDKLNKAQKINKKRLWQI
jgi:hypothetical protein